MFSNKQLEVLNQELDSNRIKHRDKGDITLSYLEGFDVIESANRVFGFGNWDYTISKLEVVSSELNHNQNHIICYKAIVQVLIHSDNNAQQVSREDVGFGSGIARTLADAHESGAKEAVTDALKRSLRSFGNQFGNSLYDRSKKHSVANTDRRGNSQYNSNNSTSNGANANQAYNTRNQTSGTSSNSQNVNNYNQSNQRTHDPYEYASLGKLGLEVVEQDGYLIVVGDKLFSKKDSIKACGFRWDGGSRTWYKPLDSKVA